VDVAPDKIYQRTSEEGSEDHPCGGCIRRSGVLFRRGDQRDGRSKRCPALRAKDESSVGRRTTLRANHVLSGAAHQERIIRSTALVFLSGDYAQNVSMSAIHTQVDL